MASLGKVKSSREGRKRIKIHYLVNRSAERNSAAKKSSLGAEEGGEDIKFNVNRRTRRRNNSDSQRTWLDLATEVLHPIMEYLSLYDQIRILCVSKRLSFLRNYMNNNNSPMNRLPWLLEFDISKSLGFTCKLFDPIHEHPYRIYRKKKFDPDYILSKNGWLFLLEEYKGSDNYSHFVAEVILFCPYSMETIVLPKLELLWSNIRRRIMSPPFLLHCNSPAHVKPTATFSSSNPRSDQQCIFFVVYFFGALRHYTISSCRKNDTEWKTHVFNIPRDMRWIINTVYHEGKLYLHLGSIEPHRELIVIYDPQQQPQPQYPKMLDVPLAISGVDYSSCLLFVHQGSMHFSATHKSTITWSVPKRFADMDVHLGSIHFSYKIDSYSTKVYKWKNFPNTQYFDFEEEILENKALFLGFEGWDYPFVVEDLRGDELGCLGNKVVHHDMCREFSCDLEAAVGQGKNFRVGKDDKRRNMAWIEPPNPTNALREFYSDREAAVVQGKYFLAAKEDKRRNMAWIEPPNHTIALP